MKKIICFITGAMLLLSAVMPAAFAAEADVDMPQLETADMAEAEAALASEETIEAIQAFAAETDEVDPPVNADESVLLKKLDTKGLRIFESGHTQNILGPDKAFDGLLGEVTAGVSGRDYWNFFESKGSPGYVGIDLGTDTPGYVKKIRYLPRFNFGERMNGAVFEGSNSGEKTGYEALAEPLKNHSNGTTTDFNLDGPNGWFEIDLTANTKMYRYLRLRHDSVVNVAEIEFYMAAGANTVATKLAAQIDTLIVNDGAVSLPSFTDETYDLSYSVLEGDAVAAISGNTVTYTASKQETVEVVIGVTVASKTDKTDKITVPVNVTVERARTNEERVRDDKALTEDLEITIYSEDENEITYLLPKTSKYTSSLTWDFSSGFENTYGDTITDFDARFYKLTVDPGGNEYLPRTVDITVTIRCGDKSDTVDRTVQVQPQVTKNMGGHIFHFKQIQMNDDYRGSVSIQNEQILLSGRGDDVWNAPDTLGYFYKKTAAEDLTISVKIDQTSAGTNRYRRFGLMFRSSDDPSAKLVMLSISPDGGGNGLRFSSRKGSTLPQATAYENLEYRGKRTFGIMKLEKKGSDFRAYYSDDNGVTFKQLIDKDRNPNMMVSFEGEYLVGLFAASSIEEPTYFSQLEIDGSDVFAADDIKAVTAIPANEKITVSWTDPTEQDIRTFDKIAVTCTDGKDFTEVKEVEKGVQTVDFENLTNGTEYTVSVQAKTADIRNGAIPAEVTSYQAYSAPVSTKAIPLDVNEFKTNPPVVKVSAPAATAGKKSEVSLKLEQPLPIYRMELDIAASSGLMVTLNDIALSDALTAAGASAEKTADGFKIRYAAKDGAVNLIEEIAKFGAGSLEAGEKTVSVSGNIVFYTPETGEVSVSPSESSRGAVTFTKSTSGGSSGSTGGGRGGSNFSGGTAPGATPPAYKPPVGDDKPQTNSRFTDESSLPDWAKTAVLELASRGVISGSPSGEGYIFEPDGKVTREQFVKMCVTAFAKVDDGASCDFSDVSADDWYYPYVSTATALGLTNGMGDGRFGVGEPITRQDMAVLLHRLADLGYADLKEAAEEIAFVDDGEIEDYAKDAVSALQKAGVINGYEDGRFAPKDAATRSMVAKMIYTILVGGAE